MDLITDFIHAGHHLYGMDMTQGSISPLAGRHFRKMNGLGNDFVVLDARARPLAVSAAEARAIADRSRGIGFDQLIVLEASDRADVFMRILNADGSEAGACGNATRCIGRLVMDETGAMQASIDTRGGLLLARDAGRWDRVTVDMGMPRFGWRDIPLAACVEDTARVPIDAEGLSPLLPAAFSAVSMGNPHAVFFVGDPAALDLERIGPILERHPLFPERANISFAGVRARDAVTLRVWERGAGLTLACGTGACATAVAAARVGLTGRQVAVSLPGGVLEIDWRDDDHVMMTGAIALDFEGELDPAIFAPGGEG